MMTKKTVFVALAFGLVTIGLTALSFRSEIQSTQLTSFENAVAQPTHDTSEDVDGLKRDLADLQFQFGRLAANRSDLSQAKAEDQEEKNEEEAKQENQEQPRSEAEETAFLAHQFETKYASQGDDPDWSVQTEVAIQDLFQNENFAGAQLGAVDCQSSLCRLELNYDSDDAKEDFFANAPTMAPLNTEGFFHLSEDGETTVLYVARDGHSLEG